MDASLAAQPVTLACGLQVELVAARRRGARAARVGLGAPGPLPDGPLASFGLAGALVPDLPPGTLLTAAKIVGEDGTELWQGRPLDVPGARPAVFCGASRVVDRPEERAELAARTGAVAVDMESGPLARSGRLVGAVRAISDDPGLPLARLARAARPDGRVAWPQVALAFATQPLRSYRSVKAARRGLASLEDAAAALAGAGL